MTEWLRAAPPRRRFVAKRAGQTPSIHDSRAAENEQRAAGVDPRSAVGDKGGTSSHCAARVDRRARGREHVPPPPTVWLVAACLLVAACRRPPPAEPESARGDAGRAGSSSRFRATDEAAACTFGQGGPFLDCGEPAERWRLRGTAAVDDEEREGSSWWAVDGRTLRTSVALDEGALDGALGWTLDARVLGTEPRSLTVQVNDRVAGTVRVEPGRPHIVSIRVDRAVLTPGDNFLSLASRPTAGARTGEGRFLVDWLHLHREGAAPEQAARPARRAVARVVSRGGESYRAFSLPDGASVVCAMPLAPRASTTAALAVEGSGEVEAEIRWRVRGQDLPPVARVVLRGSEKTWSRVDGGAPPLEGTTMAALEVRVLRATQASRLVVAELGWSAVPASQPTPVVKVDGVLVVLLSHVGRSDAGALRAAIEPIGPALEAARFRSGAASGNAAMALLLTGQQPEAVGVLDPDARMAPSPLGLLRTLRASGIHTMYSSGHPLTGAAHGFVVPEWERSITHPPTDLATAPLQDFAAWLDETRPARFFSVLHLRGGHAPFDVLPAEAQGLRPSGYRGTVDPAQVGSWWSRHPRGPLSLTDGDRERLDALHEASLKKQLDHLGKLLVDVRRRAPNTLVVVTTDVGYRPHDPRSYDEGVLLAHDALLAPLVASGLPSMTRELVSLRDVHATIAESLGVEMPARTTGLPLWRDGRDEVGFVSSGRAWSLWVGSLAYESVDGVDARLCAWSSDPECRGGDSDVPSAIREGFRRVERDFVRAAAGTRRQPVVVDGALEKSLRAWGL